MWQKNQTRSTFKLEFYISGYGQFTALRLVSPICKKISLLNCLKMSFVY